MTACQALVFGLDGNRYALPVDAVERVVRAVEITPLAGAPAPVLGVIDVAGRVTAVLDLRRQLGLPTRPIDVDDQLLIVETGRRSVALPIDETHEVVSAEVAAVDLAGGGAVPMRGVLRLGDGLVWIQDVERLLSPAEDDAVGRALAGAAQ